MIIGLMLGILILYNLYDNLPDFISYGTSLEGVALYYLILIPSLLPTVLELALLLSILFSFGTLHRNNEIISFKASGQSLSRISRSLLILGVLFSVGSFLLNAWIIPWSVEHSRDFLQNQQFQDEEKGKALREIGLIYNLGYHNEKENRLWFMNRFSERTYQGFGVNVYEKNHEGKEQFRILAREAYFDDTRGYWIFVEGRFVEFDVETSYPVLSRDFNEKHMFSFNEDPNLMMVLSKRPKDLSLRQLRGVLDNVSVETNFQVLPHAVMYHSILASPFKPLIIIIFAIPFAVSGVRSSPVIGVSKSVGLFIFYLVLSGLFELLGKKALITPIFSAWIPTVFMLLIAILFMKKEQ